MAKPIQCCGKARTTRFCPDCGKRLRNDDGLYGLLIHCRKNEEKFRSEHQRCDVSEMSDAQLIYRSSRLDAADKWKAWGDQLAQILDGQGGETP